MNVQLNLKDPQTAQIWNAINQVPDDVLEGYLADNIIDDDEIDDLTNRLKEICQQQKINLNLDHTGSALMRTMIHAAVNKIRQDQAPPKQAVKQGSIEQNLSAVSLRDIRSAMGQLLASGQISSDVQSVCRSTNVAYDEELPNMKPEEDDEDDSDRRGMA